MGVVVGGGGGDGGGGGRVGRGGHVGGGAAATTALLKCFLLHYTMYWYLYFKMLQNVTIKKIGKLGVLYCYIC